jgi:hypothetical protein
MINKKAQSEMVGFAIIVILVTVVILVFFSISLNKKEDLNLNNQEPANFLNSLVDYTTTCETSYGNFISMKKLVDYCNEGKRCNEEIDSCALLNETVQEILSSSFRVGENWPTKGYSLKILIEGRRLYIFEDGNKTSTRQGSTQKYDGGVDFNFEVYS